MEKKPISDEELSKVSGGAGGSDDNEKMLICPNCREFIRQSDYPNHMQKCDVVLRGRDRDR